MELHSLAIGFVARPDGARIRSGKSDPANPLFACRVASNADMPTVRHPWSPGHTPCNRMALLGRRVAPRVSTMQRPIRVVIAKPGLDGHDRGARVIARALMDAGMEVIYTGLRQTPEQIVGAAVDEDADLIGLSILSGAHLHTCGEVMRLVRERGLDDVPVVVGGIIPDEDLPTLQAMGVARVFQPGTPLPQVVDFVQGLVEPSRAAL